MMQSYTETLPNGHSFEMIYIQGGSFMMGDNALDDAIIHKVTLSDYWLGQYPVTQGLWKAVMGENPAHFRGDALPVESVSWEDAQEFIKELNALTDKKYNLPSEAQWEYAACGGIYQEDHSLEYAGSNQLEEVGWFDYDREGSYQSTMPPGLKAPNALGVYDMSGNVFEWCLDAYNKDFYKKPEAKRLNPLNNNYELSPYRCLRGGSWDFNVNNCQVRDRDNYGPWGRFNYYGFRLVRTL
ncbi:MAG: formylglycine-generating enzyme family protein [Microscillaceae bacterium]|nr:formylglycine-generating enzyme family protein [Microscillaceae bacterium]